MRHLKIIGYLPLYFIIIVEIERDERDFGIFILEKVEALFLTRCRRSTIYTSRGKTVTNFLTNY